MQTIDRHFLPLRSGDRVLDLGCGEGRHVVAASVIDGVDAIGVDLSLDDLATARARREEFEALWAAKHGGADDVRTPAESTPPSVADASAPPTPAAPLFALLAGDALRLPFADGAFDAVICSEVLEHIPDYRAAIAEIARVLRPGGRLCVSVPRSWCERLCWALARDYHQVPGGHLRIFDSARLRREIEAVGVEYYHRHGAHALHTLYWWLQCLFWRSRERNWLVRQYHRLLVWDMMKGPRLTRVLERALNPTLGKSVVMYFKKPAAAVVSEP